MLNQSLMIGDRRRGRGPKLTPPQETCLIERYTQTEDSPEAIAGDFGVTKMTLYNILDRHGVGRRKKEDAPALQSGGLTSEPGVGTQPVTIADSSTSGASGAKSESP